MLTWLAALLKPWLSLREDCGIEGWTQLLQHPEPYHQAKLPLSLIVQGWQQGLV